MQIIILPTAQEDLNNIFDYIIQDSIYYAELVNARIISTIGYLYTLPRMGKLVRDTPETREHVWPYQYIIRYRIIEDTVYVVAVYKYQDRPQ